MWLWESTENLDRGKRRRAFMILMSTEETGAGWADIAYFYVVVDLHRDEREI